MACRSCGGILDATGRAVVAVRGSSAVNLCAECRERITVAELLAWASEERTAETPRAPAQDAKRPEGGRR